MYQTMENEQEYPTFDEAADAFMAQINIASLAAIPGASVNRYASPVNPRAGYVVIYARKWTNPSWDADPKEALVMAGIDNGRLTALSVDTN